MYLFGTLLITAFAISITLLFIIQKKKQIKSFLREQELKFSYENSLLRTRIEVQEQTFASVSRDIHDGIGQTLSLGCVQLADLKNYTENSDVLARLDTSLQIFKKTIQDLRLLSHSLNTGMVEQQSLELAIATELDRIQAFSAIRCTHFVDPAITTTPQKRLVIFRIIQEALQNILKHAEASEIDLSIQQSDESILLSVKDNGIGFTVPDESSAWTTLGLVSMRQRASLIDAYLKITSLQNRGTEIHLAIPIA